MISIVLISLIAIGAVSAADDTAATDDADLAAVDEVQTVDSNQIDDDVSYESEDIVVTSTGDSGDDDVAAADNAKGSALGANDLTAGEKTFTELNNDIGSAQNGIVMLQNDYKYDSSDSAYQNGIDLAGTLTIIGGGHTIDGNNAARIFNIAQGANIVFVNLKLTNAANSAIYNEGTAILSGTDITNSAAEKGGAIYNTATGTIDASDCEFTDNTAVYRGGAIYSEGTVSVSDCKFDKNDVTYREKNLDNGGAAIYNLGGTITADGCTFTNNLKNYVIRGTNDQAGDLINGIITSYGSTTITDSIFDSNSACYGGAITIGNRADEKATVSITGSTFANNIAYTGAAIYISGNTDYTIDNCEFDNNQAIGYGSKGYTAAGGAIQVLSCTGEGTISNSDFTNNKVYNTVTPLGGAIATENSGDLTVDTCNFEGNDVTSGEAYSQGGAIYNSGTDLNVIGSTFTNNKATDGGAIYNYLDTDASVSTSTFTGNEADWGPAISNDGTLSLTGNTVYGDDAAILNYFGTLESTIKVTILDGLAHTVSVPTYDLTATVTDDNGNKIYDPNFVFKVGEDEVAATFDAADSIY